MFDLDHFKAYNDTHGHPAGDRLLAAVAAVWAGCLRATDSLARYGGEEFALVAPGCSAEEAAALVDRLRAAVPSESHVLGRGRTLGRRRDPRGAAGARRRGALRRQGRGPRPDVLASATAPAAGLAVALSAITRAGTAPAPTAG